MKKFLLTALLLLGVATAFAQLPAVQLKTLDGKVINTANLHNDGKPFIISFFATWCKPCNRELSAIQEVYPDWQEETGVKVYAVSIDQAQNIHKVKPLVDGKGKIVESRSGYTEGGEAHLIEKVKELEEKSEK